MRAGISVGPLTTSTVEEEGATLSAVGVLADSLVIKEPQVLLVD